MITDPKVFTPNHYTSANIIKLLQKYLKPGCSVLDVGTGSGILAITAKQMGAGRVLAVDIQEAAVKLATENADGTDVEVRINYLNFGIHEKFDITVANLEANQAMEFLQYAKDTMSDDGVLFLTWGNICFSDDYIRAWFDVIEQTKGHDYNTYVLKRYNQTCN
jgi:ribosomal protein L11 methyltransferase